MIGIISLLIWQYRTKTRMGDESIRGSQIQFFWENFKLGYEI